MPGEHALGIGVGSTDFVRTAIERGRSVETYPTRCIDGEQEALRRLSDSAFRQAFDKGMFRVRCVWFALSYVVKTHTIMMVLFGHTRYHVIPGTQQQKAFLFACRQ